MDDLPDLVAPKRKCLVCTATNDWAHLGVDACRACAAFYKRAIVNKKKYVCRQGNGKCVYRKETKYPCRKCRLDACIAIGMLYERSSSQEAPKSPLPLAAPTKFKEELPETDPLLERLSEEFETYSAIKKRNELALQATQTYRGRIVETKTGEKIMCSTLEYFNDVFPVASTTFVNFVLAAFPEFASIPIVEQRIMLKKCMANVWILETFHWTMKWFTKIGYHYATGATTCCDFSNPAAFLPPSMPLAAKEALIRNWLHYWEKIAKVAHPLLCKAELDSTEYVAVVGLLIWNLQNTTFLSEATLDLAEKIKGEVLSALGRYYRSEGKTESCSSRIGMLMSVVISIQEGGNIKKEEYETYSLLEMFERDCYIHKTMT